MWNTGSRGHTFWLSINETDTLGKKLNENRQKKTRKNGLRFKVKMFSGWRAKAGWFRLVYPDANPPTLEQKRIQAERKADSDWTETNPTASAIGAVCFHPCGVCGLFFYSVLAVAPSVHVRNWPRKRGLWECTRVSALLQPHTPVWPACRSDVTAEEVCAVQTHTWLSDMCKNIPRCTNSPLHLLPVIKNPYLMRAIVFYFAVFFFCHAIE